MQRNKIFAHSLLAGVALLALSQSPKASAETNWVQRGPHGAIQVVDSDRSPIGATAWKISGSQGFPMVVTHGSHGAVSVSNDKQNMSHTSSKMESASPQSTEKLRQSSRSMSMSTFHSSNRRSAEELLQITNPLI